MREGGPYSSANKFEAIFVNCGMTLGIFVTGGAMRVAAPLSWQDQHATDYSMNKYCQPGLRAGRDSNAEQRDQSKKRKLKKNEGEASYQASHEGHARPTSYLLIRGAD